MQQLTRLLIMAWLLHPLATLPDNLHQQPLFKIERSKNANIVQYDAQLNPDGTLFQKQPVIVYWVRLAEQGQVKKLSWLQRVFAYGFKAKTGETENSVDLFMAVDFGQPVSVISVHGTWHATIRSDQRLVLLEKIFVQAEDRGLTTKVEYIELSGKDADTGSAVTERLEPCAGRSRSFCKPRTGTESDG